ncbi:MAG: protein translocase subunit SecD [Elusimicrobia bacterium]|nr:protein translocase subunit SecD [Elusimicrobiota bacterium]
MNKAAQWKITITLALIAASLWFLFPTIKWYSVSEQEREKLSRVDDPIISKILKLGLDLQGGMHLILEVAIDKIPEDMEKSEAMARALEIIRNRVDQFGVAEPLIARQGDRWIVVQLPGISEPRRALELIGKTALLEFKLLADTDVLPESGEMSDEYEVLEDRNDQRYVVKKEAELTGAALKTAKVSMGGDFNRPHISFTLKKEAADKFARVTEMNIEKRLAIVLDGVIQSAPVIKSRIPDGQGIIEGNFNMQTARDLAIILRAGALPAPVEIIENRTIGPTLGKESIITGVTAMIIGLILVLIFMAVYYRMAGFIADIALIMNIFFLLGAMAYFHFTLTMPGIAGIILIIGMAVDANVLIFERIREELATGKTPRVAIDAGYNKAVTTILDANITTLIAAVFLFQFGTGPVKGFAVTLFIGIVASMFTAIIVSKTILDIVTKDRQIKELKI